MVTAGTPSKLHELDNRLVEDIVTFAARRFPNEVADDFDDLHTHPGMELQFAAPLVAWSAEYDGRTAAEWYLEGRGWSLSRGAEEWIASQRQAWFSMWEVLEVEPGHSLVVRDLLTGEQRTVHEEKGSREMKAHFALLVRIVDHRGVSVMCGTHPIALPPSSAFSVVERMKRVLRRKTAVAPERLRDPRIVWKMLHTWSAEVDALSQPPSLVNNDGDPILLTTDRWKLEAGSRDAVAAAIASLEGSHEDEPGRFAVMREDETVIGFIRLEAKMLLLETNSIGRADALRKRIESSCAGLLGAHIRSHSDPAALFEERSSASPAPANTAEESAIEREMKQRHYAAWLDEALPALDGKTPRAAVRTASGRERVRILLHVIEDIESRIEEEARFDVGWLRRELGLN